MPPAIGSQITILRIGQFIVLLVYGRNTSQPTDGARDVIRITRNDVGTYRDEVLYNAFEEGLDQIRFADAVRCGIDFRVYQEPVAASPGRVNTVLQIDQDGDGLGGGTPDADDYLLVVQGADLALHDGYLLT